VTRILENGEVQFQDVLTCRVRTVKQAEILRRIWSGAYVVVQGGMHAVAGTGTAAKDQNGQAGIEPLIDFRELPAAYRQDIELKLEFLTALRAGHVSRGDRARVASIIASTARRLNLARPPSASTVMAWARRYEGSDCSAFSLVSLKKLRRHDRRLPPLVEKLVADTLRAEYFNRSRLSLRHAHDCIRRELALQVKNGNLRESDATVSYATLHRRTRDVDAYHRISSREGDSRARMVCRTAIEGGSAAYPLQRVEVDHTVLDWVVVCDRTGLPLGRPTLTVAVDAFSGYLLGFYLSFYGAGVTSVVGVLQNSIEAKDELTAGLKLQHRWMSHGLADEWLLDNGLEFHARVFKAMCWELGIDMTYCRVRTPWLKPHVERFFGNFKWLTLSAGRVHKPKTNVVNPDPYKAAAISFSDLVKGLTTFVVDVYPFQVNARKLARPYDLFCEGMERCPPACYPGSRENLRLISALSTRLTVSQGGVDLRGLPYGGTELLAMRRLHGKSFKTLCKWDPNDMSSLFVQDPQDPTKWITATCTWRDYADGLSWNQHNLIRAFKRKELSEGDSEELLWQARMRLHDHWMNSSRPRSREDSLLAGRFAGLTSSKVLAGEAASPGRQASPPPTLVEDTPALEQVVPDFDAFDFGGE
jgi:putative transposase